MITKILRALMLFAVVCGSTFDSFALTKKAGNITVHYDENADGTLMVMDILNNGNEKFHVDIDGVSVATLKPNSSVKINKIARRDVSYSYPRGGGGTLLLVKRKQTSDSETVTSANTASTASQEDVRPVPADDKKDDRPTDARGRERSDRTDDGVVPREGRTVADRSLGYAEIIYQDEFYGTEAVNDFVRKVDELCKGIETANDKQQYVIDNDITQFIAKSRTAINVKQSAMASKVDEIIRRSNLDVSNQPTTVNLIEETLAGRLKTREEACDRLSAAVEAIGKDSTGGGSGIMGDDIVNYCIVGAIILLLIIITVVVIRRKNKKPARQAAAPSQSTVSPQQQSADNQNIVVRRRTTSILKKQNIDDVIDNPAYLVVNTSDFTRDSAVRRIYIKNTCIKEVYNLYAEDLRNSDKPKEDGCMVLGRWVYDKASRTYDISLEDVVFPGDDAIFREYELNFGGKIKLRIAEKLRKLRRETNLQYDLVCWIHSHPGLGVFFSNSDDNVQMQLKHSQHPNFLVAFVVDILTSNQEMGIFTFRKDGSMNSRNDLTRMYSLEEMYKWALQSEYVSISGANYFNILADAPQKLPACKSVRLNNNSIIDLTQIVIEPATGVVGWAIGTAVDGKAGREYAVSGVVRDAARPTTGIVGCLISLPQMSIPAVQQLIARDRASLAFVMVYSSAQMSLTTIPEINGELVPDRQYYGDVKIDDLKIWTRRKR